MLRLPEAHRDLLKIPFGTLYREVGDLLSLIAGRMVYSVGDVVTHNLLRAGVVPDIAIIDGYTMRVPCPSSPLLPTRRVTVKNPPGTITDELMKAIDEVVCDPPGVIFVEGEEDLAVIPLVIAAPAGSAVLYGQPGEGVVLRIIDTAAKRDAGDILKVFVRE